MRGRVRWTCQQHVCIVPMVNTLSQWQWWPKGHVVHGAHNVCSHSDRLVPSISLHAVVAAQLGGVLALTLGNGGVPGGNGGDSIAAYEGTTILTAGGGKAAVPSISGDSKGGAGGVGIPGTTTGAERHSCFDGGRGGDGEHMLHLLQA